MTSKREFLRAMKNGIMLGEANLIYEFRNRQGRVVSGGVQWFTSDGEVRHRLFSHYKDAHSWAIDELKRPFRVRG